MDLKSFKLDIDELINDFVEGGSTRFVEFKKVWLSKKFSFIFEASPSSNQGCFMQSLYAHSIGELKKLKNLIVEAKRHNIKVVSALVGGMLESNMFLLGSVETNEGSAAERVNELTDIQNARIQVAYKKLFANTQLEHFIHLDLGRELDADLLKKTSAEYAMAKELAIREASKVIDVENVKHIAENKRLIGDTVKKIASDWDSQKEAFYQKSGFHHQSEIEAQIPGEIIEFSGSQRHDKRRKLELSENTERKGANGSIVEGEENNEFGKELEEVLLYQSCEDENDENEGMEYWGEE